MAFDVHDGPMQDLIAVGFGVRALRDRVLRAVAAEDAEPLSRGFGDLEAHLAAVEQALRSVMFSLEHGAARETSLLDAVNGYVVAFQRHNDATIEVSVEGDVEPATESQRIAIERVIREALSNVGRHAAADHVAITLRGTSDSILLQVFDNGCGFDPHVPAKHHGAHVGLEGMRERLRMIEGDLSVDSRPGGPTVITATLKKWRPAGDGPAQDLRR
jgi:signal transduction histidine kinase